MQYDDMVKSRMYKRARGWLQKAEAKKHTFIVESALDEVLRETPLAWRFRLLRWRVRAYWLRVGVRTLWPIGRTIDACIKRMQNELKKGHRV